MHRYSRREFLEVTAAGTGAFATACSLDVSAPRIFTHADALITARPSTPTQTPTIGYSALGLTTPRDGLLYVPTTYQANSPAPLVLALHGNGGSAQYWEDIAFGELLDDLGVVVLAPDSRFARWDIIFERGYSSDPKFFNTALAYTFARCNINPARVAIAGFDDGGLEALGVGLANGDLFSAVLAYSPGVLAVPFVQGKPKIFLAHGLSDPVIPFENAQNIIVPRLTDAGYTLNFVPFDGGHEVPSAIARQSVEWFLA